MRVLVVEDDRKVASFIQKGLEEEGYAVDVLNDGDEAGVQAQIIDYDCVVLDRCCPAARDFSTGTSEPRRRRSPADPEPRHRGGACRGSTAALMTTTG
jgi:DNA-binding response OmpR family regulator